MSQPKSTSASCSESQCPDTVLCEAPLTDAVVQLTGEDGNAFFILGKVRNAILRSNHPELADAFWQEATSGDYDFLLQTCMRYVEVN